MTDTEKTTTEAPELTFADLDYLIDLPAEEALEQERAAIRSGSPEPRARFR